MSVFLVLRRSLVLSSLHRLRGKFEVYYDVGTHKVELTSEHSGISSPESFRYGSED